MSGRIAALACLGFVAAAAWADEFDDLRLRWRGTLTGSDVDLGMPQVRTRLASIESTARGYWDRMDKSAGRRVLWSDLASATDSGQITSNWRRLRDMAVAWATRASVSTRMPACWPRCAPAWTGWRPTATARG